MKKVILTLLFLIVSPLAFADAISTDNSDFQKVSDVIYDAAYDIRYYSENNFTGHRITGYKAPVAYMTKDSLKGLHGWVCRIFES